MKMSHTLYLLCGMLALVNLAQAKKTRKLEDEYEDSMTEQHSLDHHDHEPLWMGDEHMNSQDNSFGAQIVNNIKMESGEMAQQ